MEDLINSKGYSFWASNILPGDLVRAYFFLFNLRKWLNHLLCMRNKSFITKTRILFFVNAALRVVPHCNHLSIAYLNSQIEHLTH